MPYKTIYVRPGDEPLFEAAEHFAKRTRSSLSALIATALQDYLDRAQVARDQ